MVTKRQLDRIKYKLQPEPEEDSNIYVYLHNPETGIIKGKGETYTEKEFEEREDKSEHDVRLVRGDYDGD